MPYKNKEDRKKHYDKNKDAINEKRRKYNQIPEIKKKKNDREAIWRKNNRERANELSRISKKKYEEKCKKLVFEHYGKKCVCCGEECQTFLTIDHINGCGRIHRKKIGEKINIWLYKNNFPEGFQTLCFNCNWGKHINGGICPHQQKPKS